MRMTFTELSNGVCVAEVIGADASLRSESDAVQLIGNASFHGADGMLLDDATLTPEFFDLSTGVAGEIVQKFVNYRMRVAIVRANDAASSRSFEAFVAESNRGGHVVFVGSREEGLARLGV